jgi:hypothetical protein
MANPSPKPMRNPSGFSTDMPGGPTAQMGLPNPAFYHTVFSDFDDDLTVSGVWTKTATGNGSVAHTPGDGGQALFSTNSSTPLVTDIAAIQKPAAGFTLPTTNDATQGKKIFFCTRVNLAEYVNTAFLAGLIQTTTTPFTVTDGIYFLKATGSATNLILRSTVASANTDIVIPTTAYVFQPGVSIDLGWYINRQGALYAFIGTQLVGWVLESQSGGLVGQRGPVASGSPSLTTANLNPTIAFQSGTATAKTAKADFALWAKER